jgi:hypothetical protein
VIPENSKWVANFCRIVGPIVTFFDYRLFLGMAKHIIPIWKQRTSAPMVDEKKKVSLDTPFGVIT